MKKVLVVDDEYLIGYSLSATFKDADTEVITAPNGGAALKAIDENYFDLCMLDIHLPDGNGLDIMRKLRWFSPGTKIVIMTGSEVTETMMKSVQENAHLLITKPFDLDRLKELAGGILAQGRPMCREECAALKDQAPFVQWIADNNRKNERKPISTSITCFPVDRAGEMSTGMLSARVIDISEAGMCIRTDQPLRPGHVLRLRDAPTECTGIVRWSRSADSAESCEAGIQFVTTEDAKNGIRH
jgi:CheY-like chemotaxis protein